MEMSQGGGHHVFEHNQQSVHAKVDGQEPNGLASEEDSEAEAEEVTVKYATEEEFYAQFVDDLVELGDYLKLKVQDDT